MIQSLDLTFSSMSAATVESISELGELKELKLGYGQLDDGVMNLMLQKLPRLERLGTGRLADSRLSLHDHRHLRELRNNDPHIESYYEPVPEDTWVCRDVDLSNLDQLEGTVKLMHPLGTLRVKNLPKLTELIAMRTVEKAELSGLSGLQKIGVGGPSITDEDASWMAQCTTLTHVSLPYTTLTDSSLGALVKLESLAHLSVPGTKVTDEVITKLKNDQLLRVNLRDTNVTANGIRHILQSPKLETLIFNCPGLTANEISSGIKSDSLAVLSIPHVTLTPAELSALLKKAPNLVELDFVGVDIDANMLDLLAATDLRRLRVSEGKLDGKAALMLAESLPFLRFGVETADMPTQAYLQLYNADRTLKVGVEQQGEMINEIPLVDEEALRVRFLADSMQNQ